MSNEILRSFFSSVFTIAIHKHLNWIEKKIKCFTQKIGMSTSKGQKMGAQIAATFTTLHHSNNNNNNGEKLIDRLSVAH